MLEHADHGLDCADAVVTARALAGALEQLCHSVRGLDRA